MPQVSAAHAAFGAAVRARREELGYSQESLAAEAGMHRNYIGAVERGEQNIALANILRISRVLGVSATRFIEQAERTSP